MKRYALLGVYALLSIFGLHMTNLSQHSSNSYKSTFAAQGIVDSNGNITIQFPQIPSGSYATGSVTIFDAPPTVQWLVQVNGITKDQALGAASTGGIQISASDILQYVGSGLNAYAGQTFHGTFDAVVSPEYDTNLTTIAHDPLTVTPQGVTQGFFLGEIIDPSGVQQQTYNIPPGTTTILVFATPPGGAQTVTVAVTGAQSFWPVIPTTTLTVSKHSILEGFVIPGLDQQINVSVNVSLGQFMTFFFVAYSIPPLQIVNPFVF